MSLELTEKTFRSKLGQVGRAAMHALFPKDIEFYFLALELVDSQGNTVDYFAWPVLPSDIRENQNELTAVRKTMHGVNVLINPTFNPFPISIRGDFGRRFKILLGDNAVEFAGFGASIKNGKFDLKAPNYLQNPIPQFSSFAKTGYGCIKVLEAIKEKMKKLDDNQKPHSLYLYNPILGGNYQVVVNSFSHSQNDNANNMIPAYGLQLTAIAPLDNILSRRANVKTALKNLVIGGLQKTANRAAANIKLIPGLM